MESTFCEKSELIATVTFSNLNFYSPKKDNIKNTYLYPVKYIVYPIVLFVSIEVFLHGYPVISRPGGIDKGPFAR